MYKLYTVILNEFIAPLSKMEQYTLDFNNDIALSHEEIIKNVTIIDEGIQESGSHTNTFENNEIINNAPITDEGIQDTFAALLKNTPVSDAEVMQNTMIVDDRTQDNFQVTSRAPLTHAEIIKNATIIDEGIKLCPLCRNEVRLFFINFNEKVLMCENFECDYPFGHEDIIYVKENNSIQFDEEVASINSRPTHSSPTATCSVISTAAWSEIDKINKINDSESHNDARTETREYYRHKKAMKKEKTVKSIEENPNILKQVEAIAKMHIELKQNEDRCIKNEKWIKKLMNMQQTSGMTLLKPEEINMLKQKKPELGLGELKIDINPGSNKSMSLIKIQIANTDAEKAGGGQNL